MTNFEITEEDFNQLSEADLNKVLISFNDGQGDNCVYDWKGIIQLLEDIGQRLDITGTEDDLAYKTNIEILDMFYDGNELGGNNSNLIYFDGEMKNLMFI
jgi:hypothetical protein